MLNSHLAIAWFRGGSCGTCGGLDWVSRWRGLRPQHPPPMTLLLKSPGLSKNGKNRPANPISNGRRQLSSPKDVRDSSKHSNLLLDKSTTLEEVVTGGTTIGGTNMTNAPPLKEDTIWTLTLQSPQTSMLLLAEDNSTPKPGTLSQGLLQETSRPR